MCAQNYFYYLILTAIPAYFSKDISKKRNFMFLFCSLNCLNVF